MPAPRIRVLVVDDSALMRELLVSLLSRDPQIEVVAAVADPVAAVARLKQSPVDVMTLDVEMPRMDGLTFLEKLMRAFPLPVVMISSLTERGAATTFRALELGAVDFVAKPRLDVQSGTVEMAAEIIRKVKGAARARVRPRGNTPAPSHGATATTGATGTTGATSATAATGAAMMPGVATSAATGAAPRDALIKSTHKVIAIGASTGGTEALRELLCALPPDSPGIVIVQHMPARFTQSFAQRLDGLAAVRVREARDGDRILPGHVLIAPGDFHMQVARSGANYGVRVFSAEPVNHHRPSVDILFDSCARYLGANAVGVILTGMGADGAHGLRAMHSAGARTIAQDEATCVVFGMPKEAIALGAVDEVLAIEQIPGAVLRAATG
jgi:two-component system chemotaxis response regulator CheB